MLEAELEIVALIRRHRPDVVLTVHGAGISYHRDHRVLTLATMGAFLGSGEASWYREEPVAALSPHRPARLYGFTVDRSAPFRDDWPRAVYQSSPEEITTVIDPRDWADTKWRAIAAHDSQRDGPPFRALYDAGAFDEEHWVRIFPPGVPGGKKETGLLDGLD